ncbi:acetyl-CoA carboxylase carboxyltransferase component [Pseudomonas baetica]|nr:acetyl-CoA carboxylase carboxyltransferase component [Pseudomonas baetica]
MGLPQVTVVHGSATAGGAYQPGLSDYVVVVRGKAKLFLAGPPLLKAATGEVATDEELGGAEMHAQTAGTAEYLAENDADGVRQVREIVSLLPWNQQLPRLPERHWEEPLYPIDELLGLIPVDPKKPYDVREIIARLADASNFLEFKGEFDQQTVCGHLKIQGRACGFIGNNGPITPKGASKAAQFIQLCDQSRTPLLFFHNTTGFMVGTESEQQGVIKHGAKMIQAVANARVPKLTIVVGGSYGAGNYAMCGRGLDPRFIFAWPNSRTAVMGGAQGGQSAAHRHRGQTGQGRPGARPKNARHAGTGYRAETRQPVHRALRQRQSVGRRIDRPAGYKDAARLLAGYLSRGRGAAIASQQFWRSAALGRLKENNKNDLHPGTRSTAPHRAPIRRARDQSARR